MGIAMYFDVLAVVLFGLIWIGIVVLLQLKKKRGFVYLIFFTVFYVYLFKVLDYTLFQFQSLLLLRFVIPGIILNGIDGEDTINLIPLFTLASQDLETSLLNILLFVPFGFGLPFITKHFLKKTVGVGALFSVGIEFLQLATGYMSGVTFRIADINDVIFNTIGVAIGYFLFIGFVRVCRYAPQNGRIASSPMWRYVVERPQVKRCPGASSGPPQ